MRTSRTGDVATALEPRSACPLREISANDNRLSRADCLRLVRLDVWVENEGGRDRRINLEHGARVALDDWRIERAAVL